ncbi:hypothetical protein TPA0910_34010 [Streptomyces hygroscopicus subsp. sporocinereus]|uniref:Uncharacterized protein n=1 Tax=Streptomyces hygroscopicus TaxID=1912 RepID=A0ABQ3U029_STRHY|nr:hypothetical protein TPA0910_34010 [Streptomyces hygroscopicus]
MARAGQPQGLGALADAHVEHPQPLSHREAGGDLLIQLVGDQRLPEGVPQGAEAAQPAARPAGEAGGLAAQGRSPRLTCGLGSRSRRI